MHTDMKEGRLKQMTTVASSQMIHLDDLSEMCPGLQSATASSFLSNLYSSRYHIYSCIIDISVFLTILE
jgi:hypothetical protein